MKIQSLSVVVPNNKCINNCKFCVSSMKCSRYSNRMDENTPEFHQGLTDYIKRLEFARDNGCNTIMLTGTSEPQQNRKFLTYFGMLMMMMQHPFRWIEMQTTGTLINQNWLSFLRTHVGVNLISLSVSSFSDVENNDIIGTPGKTKPSYIHLYPLCRSIRENGFSLRLSLNLTSAFNDWAKDPQQLFQNCRILCADQVTLRVLYTSGKDTPQDAWIQDNAMPKDLQDKLHDYVRTHGTILGVLPHGAVKYSLHGMCVVIDTDCMDKAEKQDENYKYLILRPDCRLYSQWDDPASLIF